MIVDYSTSRPPPGLLQSLGVTSVGRYIGWDSVPGYPSIGKNITVSEAHELISAGISVFLAFEYAADAAGSGTAQGSSDGKLARSQLAALGAPPDMCVYFAVDFDIPDYAPSLPDTPNNAMAKLGPVGRYFQSINALRYPYEVGGYGGYWAISRLFNADLITKGWQTVAWSGPNIDNRAVLYQVVSAAPIVGADIDIREHTATDLDFGQWPRPAKPPIPVPTPSPTPAVKEWKMVIIEVTAPSGHSWTGTRTFLYSGPPSVPTHIVSGQDQTNFAKSLPTITVTWNQYTELGGQ